MLKLLIKRTIEKKAVYKHSFTLQATPASELEVKDEEAPIEMAVRISFVLFIMLFNVIAVNRSVKTQLL